MGDADDGAVGEGGADVVEHCGLGVGIECRCGLVKQQHLLEVGEAHLLVHVQKTLYLMEEAVGSGADGLVAIHAARAYHPDRRLLFLHHAALHRAGVGAQYHFKKSRDFCDFFRGKRGAIFCNLLCVREMTKIVPK